MSRFQTLYHETVVPELIKKFGYKSAMQVPRITKKLLTIRKSATSLRAS